jgi:hypothetical protein
MERQGPVKLPSLEPSLQVSFYYRLQSIRETQLHFALSRALDRVDLDLLNSQLGEYVSADGLKRVAAFGLRGEVVFPVPCVLEADPLLLGYYRLLLGFSQKEFYNRGPFGRFKSMEETGSVLPRVAEHVPALCRSLVGSAQRLVRALDQVLLDVIRDLQLLTLGPQLRGSENTRVGQRATREVFDLIRELVRDHVTEETKRTILVRNDAGRMVLIAFSSDPDISIREQLPSGVRPLVSVEIKGGKDISNVHNRLGEAEKTHQKARARGFFEFWTLLRAKVPEDIARRESPTTSHFFQMGDVLRHGSPARARFRDLLCSIISIRSGPGAPRQGDRAPAP